VEAGGASWLTIHCRTKADGYKPPAYWEWIPRIKEQVKVPIVANGEIWTVDDFWKCFEVTQCHQIMIGRGAVARPFLFKQIKESIAKTENPQPTWERTRVMIPRFFAASTQFKSPYFAQARTKQWLRALSLQNEEAKPLFEELKVFTNPFEFRARLETLCS
jgi:tRNA-dihydrouridine synthase C